MLRGIHGAILRGIHGAILRGIHGAIIRGIIAAYTPVCGRHGYTSSAVLVLPRIQKGEVDVSKTLTNPFKVRPIAAIS